MVRTETDMIFNLLIPLLNQPPPHQPPQNQPHLINLYPNQPPSYQPLLRRPRRNFQSEDFSDGEELNNSFYQEDDFEDAYEDGGMAYGQKRFSNPIRVQIFT